MAYVSETEMRTYGITDPSAIDLIPQASSIIDLYVTYPTNDDGFKFPRVGDDYLGIPDDAGVVPDAVKKAVLEQIIWMLSEGMQYVRKGGDNTLSVALPGYANTKPENDAPLLAPLARLHLRRLMTRVGWTA